MILKGENHSEKLQNMDIFLKGADVQMFRACKVLMSDDLDDLNCFAS